MGWLKRRIIEELEPTMAEWERRWIPIDESLPDVDALVIACVNGRHVVTLRRHKQEGFWQHEDGDIDQINVTHWMGLPAPPTDAK